jgi:hypothetical protein
MDSECFKSINWNFFDLDVEDKSDLIKWRVAKTEERVETYEVEYE